MPRRPGLANIPHPAGQKPEGPEPPDTSTHSDAIDRSITVGTTRGEQASVVIAMSVGGEADARNVGTRNDRLAERLLAESRRDVRKRPRLHRRDHHKSSSMGSAKAVTRPAARRQLRIGVASISCEYGTRGKKLSFLRCARCAAPGTVRAETRVEEIISQVHNPRSSRARLKNSGIQRDSK